MYQELSRTIKMEHTFLTPEADCSFRFIQRLPRVTCEEWSEQEMGRDMWPSFAGMLELGALKRIYTLQRIHKEVRPTSHIYLATQPVGKAGKATAPELLMRALYLSKIQKDSLSQCLAETLDVALDEVEHAMLDPRVSKFGPTVTSCIFLHFLSELDMSTKENQEKSISKGFCFGYHHVTMSHWMLNVNVRSKIVCHYDDHIIVSLALSRCSNQGSIPNNKHHMDVKKCGFEWI